LRPARARSAVAEIDADDVAPSLRWAIAKPERAAHTRGNTDRSAERGQFNDEPPTY
jgi:hypothetical protein